MRPRRGVDEDEAPGSYRSELGSALARIAQLEAELATFRVDPSYERVALAEEALAHARARRRSLQRMLPRLCIAGFVAMGAFALTDPSLPVFVHGVAYALCAVGGFVATTTILAMLVLSAQGERPKAVVDLERRVRLAKGDVGKRVRIDARAVERARAESEAVSVADCDGEDGRGKARLARAPGV